MHTLLLSRPDLRKERQAVMDWKVTVLRENDVPVYTFRTGGVSDGVSITKQSYSIRASFFVKKV